MKKQYIKKLIKEAFIEVLLEQDLKPEEEEKEVGDETVLEDVTDTILEKFPTVRKILIKLMTEDFKEFVEDIEWISPKPTSFRIVLKNDQDFTITWQGKNFEANIKGKDYYLGKINEFQQALDKLSILYQEGPMVDPEETEGSLDSEFGDSTGGGEGGEFPGEEPAGDDFDEPEEDGEEEGEDLGDAEIDFEEPGEEPE